MSIMIHALPVKRVGRGRMKTLRVADNRRDSRILFEQLPSGACHLGAGERVFKHRGKETQVVFATRSVVFEVSHVVAWAFPDVAFGNLRRHDGHDGRVLQVGYVGQGQRDGNLAGVFVVVHLPPQADTLEIRSTHNELGIVPRLRQRWEHYAHQQRKYADYNQQFDQRERPFSHILSMHPSTTSVFTPMCLYREYTPSGVTLQIRDFYLTTLPLPEPFIRASTSLLEL